MIRKRNLRNTVSSRNSNKRLYESIMRDVAKTVKNNLNENYNDDIELDDDEYFKDTIDQKFDSIKFDNIFRKNLKKIGYAFDKTPNNFLYKNYLNRLFANDDEKLNALA
jgi:hypothetical protein